MTWIVAGNGRAAAAVRDEAGAVGGLAEWLVGVEIAVGFGR